ncbi:hypothetical protein RB195_024201 [Necator americanus]|uniref:Reverse transcriptase domain-containing protein n=1 Tax=Necator americanus TaxID=51031 RepID=A0ABR1EMC2_NECAM
MDRLIKHREETTRDEQAGFRPGRSTIDQVFIVRRVIEIWQRCSKPMQLAFLDFGKTVDQCPADIILSPSGCPLTDLGHDDNVVIFAGSTTKLLHVVNLVSKLAAAYGLRLGLVNASRCGSVRDLERESGVCHNEDICAVIDVVYRWMTRGRYQHLAPPSKVAKVNRLRFFGHILRRPADCLVQRVLRTLGMDRQFRREARFRRLWNSDE